MFKFNLFISKTVFAHGGYIAWEKFELKDVKILK